MLDYILHPRHLLRLKLFPGVQLIEIDQRSSVDKLDEQADLGIFLEIGRP